MATIQLGNTKKISSLIDYCENKAEISNGFNCLASSAKEQMKATRMLYDKNTGVQGHHVIQSFKPNEIDAQNANMAGLALAKKIAPNHEVMVYTHTDREHIHNHIVINSVNYENGSKYQSKKKDLFKIRDFSDEICLEMNLSVLKEKSAEIRYTLAEKSLLEKGKTSWKDELRQAIDYELKNSRSYQEFKNNLKDNYDIVINDSRKHITYKHPDMQKVVRGNKLGLIYEKEMVINVFERQIERQQGDEHEKNRERENQIASREVRGSSNTREYNQRDRSAVREQSTTNSFDGVQDKLRDVKQRINQIGEREQKGDRSSRSKTKSFDRGL